MSQAEVASAAPLFWHPQIPQCQPEQVAAHGTLVLEIVKYVTGEKEKEDSIHASLYLWLFTFYWPVFPTQIDPRNTTYRNHLTFLVFLFECHTAIHSEAQQAASTRQQRQISQAWAVPEVFKLSIPDFFIFLNCFPTSRHLLSCLIFQNFAVTLLSLTLSLFIKLGISPTMRRVSEGFKILCPNLFISLGCYFYSFLFWNS